ncbi:unnamed protein product [Rotaria magnacalcarata]|uniref:RRM domain-containing protein n=2 Tax=Rotaria magnacalcarata TaxID=392030 RepID=A0A819WC91_9BILA|nr:unnamed protein product [Rotaria magnacalcarata]CAF1644053.1 unnamed protein product [Rotaria magnacalcarata]CAF2043792.1 unnamed protein product [Rotaria magnacalcarata]CAF2135157.1 unnamed protein product [Rotaria magnacalcarata]CAF2144774.1 unnamed protein product [Rotaria magnacalcarata]
MGRHRSDSRSRSRSMSSSSSGRGTQSSKWNGETGYRVHISDLAAGVSRKEVERVFGKYGTVNEVWVATNPPCFAFVNFKHRSDADKAIREVDGKIIGSTRVGVSWARTRTYGGRNRGGRGYSYRHSGSRRRSRSRSRSGSRHRRYRSRSKRSRRHSGSPRDRKRVIRSNDRQKSRSSRSISRSRSRSRSSARQKSPRNANGRSRSRSSSADDRHDNRLTGSSSSAAKIDGNNSYDRSPIAAGGD